MGIKMGIPKTVEVEAKKLTLHVKVCDGFAGTLYATDGQHIGDYEGYVPKFFPGQHYGDYLILEIDVATGQITNWQPPTAQQLKDTFTPTVDEE